MFFTSDIQDGYPVFMPFNKEEPDGTARTKESYAHDSYVGRNLVDSKGVCVLSQLSSITQSRIRICTNESTTKYSM